MLNYCFATSLSNFRYKEKSATENIYPEFPLYILKSALKRNEQNLIAAN